MKTIIDTYPNRILDLDLVVITNPSVVELQDKFTKPNGDSIPDDYCKDYPARATVLKSKETEDIVLVVILHHVPNYVKKKPEFEQTCYIVSTIAHEAFHILMFTMDIIEDSLNTNSQEMPAYYMGWITECVYRTWIKSNDTVQKRKKTKG